MFLSYQRRLSHRNSQKRFPLVCGGQEDNKKDKVKQVLSFVVSTTIDLRLRTVKTEHAVFNRNYYYYYFIYITSLELYLLFFCLH